MLIITAPSKTQQFSGCTHQMYSLPPFMEKTVLISNRLKKMSQNDLGTMMKTSIKLSEATYQKVQSFQESLTLANAKQSIFMFQGDAYSAIKPENYSDMQLKFAHEHLFILSGLYGVLRPLDLMQPYRLEMATKLQVSDCKNLYQYWSKEITAEVNKELAKSDSQTLINLASNEYSKVVRTKDVQGKVITIIFQQQKNGDFKTIPIYSKRARGMMIHHAILNEIKEPEELKTFSKDGYRFNRQESTPNRWIFQQK